MSYKRIIILYFPCLFVFYLAFLFCALPIIAEEGLGTTTVGIDSVLSNVEDSFEDPEDPIKNDTSEDMDMTQNESPLPLEETQTSSSEDIDTQSSNDKQPLLSKDEEAVDLNVARIVQLIAKNDITNAPLIKLDQDIFLFLCGFGEAKLAWTHSIEFFHDHVDNILQPPVFIQEANLSLLLLMKQRWYFGVNYKEKIYDSSVYLGYIDIENNVKKHIRLGNRGITFPSIYPFIRGESSNLAPGLSTTFEGEKWRVDSVIRYDSSKKEKRVFYGKNELVENHFSISSWKKSQYFYIPHPNLFGKIPIVHVKDTEMGEWRILGKDQYTIDSRNNILILKKGFPYGVAINLFETITVANTIEDIKDTFSATALGGLVDDNVYLEISGTQYLCLKKYKSISPFEIASVYLFDNIRDMGEAYVVNKNTTDRVNEFGIKLGTLSSFFEETGISGQVYSVNAKLNYEKSIVRYPFLENNSHIYLPVIQDDEKNTFELLSYFYTTVSGYVLPKDTDVASIEVF